MGELKLVLLTIQSMVVVSQIICLILYARDNSRDFCNFWSMFAMIPALILMVIILSLPK